MGISYLFHYVFVVSDLMYREIWKVHMQLGAYFLWLTEVARYVFIVYVERYVSSVEVQHS